LASVCSLTPAAQAVAFSQKASRRLKMSIAATPSRAAWVQMAVPAPPHPITVIFRPVTSTPCSPRARM
jgi:hypothetical protein